MAKKEFLKLARDKAKSYWAQFRIYDRVPQTPECHEAALQVSERFMSRCVSFEIILNRLRHCKSRKKYRELVRETENQLASMNRELFELKAIQLKEARSQSI